MPFELRPYPTTTLRPEDSYLHNAWRTSVYPMAARMGIEIKLPTVSPQPYTRLAFEGLEFAKDSGRAEAYNSAVMRGFFQRDLDIGKVEVLAGLAAESGLDAARFRESLDTGAYRQRTHDLLRHACEEMHISGVPLFVVGEIRLPGLQDRGALEAAIARAESSASPQA